MEHPAHHTRCHPRTRPHANPRWLPALCALLTACGGGGGGGSTGPDKPPEPLACVDLPEITWHRSATASADWSDVLVDRNNRIWLAGYTDGQVGQARYEPSGNSRALVRQLSPTGTVLWDSGSLLDTPGTDVAEALAISAAGTVYVAGRTTGQFSGSANAGQFDTFVAWADTPATPASWRSFQAGNERPQHPRRLSLAPNGDLHLAGYDDDYIPSNYVEAWTDPFAVKLRRLDAGGSSDHLATQWSQQFNTPEPDTVDGLAVDAQGASYISGLVASGPQRGIFVRKLNAQGQVLWTTRYTASPADNIAALKAMPDGTLLMAGSVFGAFAGGAVVGGQDIFLARIDAGDGHVLASWQFGTAQADWLTDMAVDGQGNIVLFGETQGAWWAQAPAGMADLFLLKISPSGQLLARRQWGTPWDERAQHLALDSCGRAVAVGSSTQAGQRAGVLWFWTPEA